MLNHLSPFLIQLTAEKYLSKNTVINYERDISSFFVWYENSELEVVDDRAVRYFVSFLSGKKQASASIARKLSSLRQFFDYLVSLGFFSTNPAANVKSPKKKQVLPKALSVDDINQMLDKKSDGISIDLTNPLDCRDYAIIELFYSTGMRLSELSSLDVSDLEVANEQIHILGKGNKERIVLLGSKAKRAMLDWLEMRKKLINVKRINEALFLGKNGTRLSNRSIQLRIKSWANKLDINVGLHPHMLRHSFASHILQSSGDLRAVQEMLGHSSISSTQIYTHMDFQHLSKVYDASHPRAKKNKK